MKVWIFDTETTDLDDDREIIEAAWIDIYMQDDYRSIPLELRGIEYCERFNPTKPISYGSMAVHNILPYELDGCADPDDFHIHEEVAYLVGHNIDFDWVSAGSPEDIQRICTDAIARHTWPDAGSYSQSALLYMICGETDDTRKMLRDAHSALADVRNNVVLLKAILRQHPEITSWDALWEYSEECRIPTTCPFQKHKGVPLTTLVNLDRGYCEWMLRQDWLDPYLRTGVRRAMGFE